MPLKPCLDCGRLSPHSRCERHGGNTRITPGRGTGWQATAFRQAVLDQAGHRCEFVNAQGARCTAMMGLEAHHVRDLRDGGSNDPANGRCLCRRHHKMLTGGPSSR